MPKDISNNPSGARFSAFQYNPTPVEEGVSQRGKPSNSILENNLPKPGLETNLESSLIKTRLPGGAERSTRYIEPSHLYKLEDLRGIYSDYNKISNLSQQNVKPFLDDLQQITGIKPSIRVKEKESYENK